MARLMNFETTKTYASVKNAIKAVEKSRFGSNDELRYFIHRDENTGRFYPIFVGEKAIQAMVHFEFHVTF